ncbi:MAG: c-type cytochrome [Pedosphaera sp.]|nr:c-type cytochrome [Pedosphaera sp.]
MKLWSLLLPAIALAPFAASAATNRIGEHSFVVPDGFTLERVSSPDLVQRPISASFDARGRLYVTDSSGTNDKQDKQLLNPTHRIVCLEDTNGDGTFDRSTVFADKLAFPEGCLWFEGSVYVAVPPSIWKLTDTNGDGICDVRMEWYKGGVLTGCANDVHGPYLGPDGRIYWTKGAFAQLDLKDGRGRPIQDRAAHIFRAKPDGSELEVVMSGGMDNPVEVAFTPEGEALFTTTFVDFTQPGRRDGLCHAVYGGVFGKQQDAIDDRRVKRTGELLEPLVQFGAGAPSGLCRFEGGGLGPEYVDNFFASLFNLHKVTRHVVRPNAAGLVASSDDFVVSDNPDFHPTDVLEDADGSLLVVDTGGWYKMCCPSSQLAKADVLGAIYRMRRSVVIRPTDPRGLQIDWARARPKELLDLLDDDRPAVRNRACAAMGGMGDQAVAAISAYLAKGSPNRVTPRLASKMVWALNQIPGNRARQLTLEAAKQDPTDSSARKSAVKSLSLWRTPIGEDSRFLQTFGVKGNGLGSGSPRLLAEWFGRTGQSNEVIHLMADLSFRDRSFRDRIAEHSIIYALIELNQPEFIRSNLLSVDASPAPNIIAFRNGISTSTFLPGSIPYIRRAGLIALDQMDHDPLKPDELLPYLTATNAVLRDTAWWIVQRHSDWGLPLAGWLRERLMGLPGEGSVNQKLRQIRDRTHGSGWQPTPEKLTDLLSRFSIAPEVQSLLGEFLTRPESGAEARSVVLSAMAKTRPADFRPGWKDPALAHLIHSSPEVARAAVGALKTFVTGRTNGISEVTQRLVEAAGDESKPDAFRLDAASAIPAGTRLPSPLFGWLKSRLDPAQPPLVRSAVIGNLARARLDLDQRLALVDVIKTAGPLELPKLLDALSAPPDEAVGLKAISALQESKASAGLRPDQFQGWLGKYPAPVAAVGASLLARINVEAAHEKAHLEEIASALPRGDVRRGQSLFNDPKVACSTCHRMGYLGGNVGPDLTRIGEVRTQRDLLESILYPSLSFVRSYESIVVTTRSGDLVNGIVKREDDRGIQLVTGPNAEQEIARAEISELRPGTVSIMPAGLEQQLSRQELSDLVAFLKNTTWGPR